MSAVAATHAIIQAAEDDVRSVPELLMAIETIGKYAHAAGQGLDPDECFALYRLAVTTTAIAQRVEKMWEEAFAASGGRA